MKLCKVCDERPARSKDRCVRCDNYFRRHDKERPKEGVRALNNMHPDFVFFKPYPGLEWKSWWAS